MIDLTHDELANNLAIHLINDNRMVWEDIPVGKIHSVRPDVLTIEKSYSSPNPISYEIKVSVSDFRSDVTKAKWKAYLDFSYGVVFAVPKGLIKKSDVPNGCGLITFNGQSWNTVKRPTLHPAKLNDELLLKLLISGEQRETQKLIIKNRDFDEHLHHDVLRKKFGKDFRSKIAMLENYPEKKKELRRLKKELAGLFDLDVDSWCFERDVKYHIDQLKIMADESERKAKIASQIVSLRDVIVRKLDDVVKNYTD